MSRQKVREKPKLMYELPTEIVGKVDGRVTRKLKVGLPDDYNRLLDKATTDTNLMVVQQIQEAARLYVPKLYDILIKNDYDPQSAGNQVKEDCRKMWGLHEVLKHIPDLGKNESKQKGAKIAGKNRTAKAAMDLEEFVKEIEPIVPVIRDLPESEQKTLKKGLAKANKKTRVDVATKGGNATNDKYGLEHYKEMGKKSAESRQYAHQMDAATAFEYVIYYEEHKRFVDAFEESLMSVGSKEHAAYTIAFKGKDLVKVEPHINGQDAQKTVNK